MTRTVQKPAVHRMRTARHCVQGTAAVIALAMASGSALAAQENGVPPRQGEPVVIGQAVTIRSEILGEDRRVLTRVPSGYDQSTQRFPVLYLLDGEGHFHHVTGIVDFLVDAGRMPPMIVVGIANTDRDRDTKPAASVTRRTEELLPFGATITTEYPTAGGADRFLRFLAEELTPWIETHYRVADFRLLVGHSSAGLFALHALLTHPDVFNATVAISPSLSWDDGALVRKAAAGSVPAFDSGPRFLYMAVGDEGATRLGDFATVLELADRPGLRWWYRIKPLENHASVAHRAIYDGLETIFSEYAVSEPMILAGDVARLERRFASASRTYGYEIRPPERLIAEMGEVQLELFRRPEKAIEVFERYAALYPESPDAHDGFADALEAAGRLDEALHQREEAVRRAVDAGDPRAPRFRQKLDSLRARIGADPGAGAGPDLVAQGDSLMGLGLFDRAIELHERAAALEPDRDVTDGRLYRAYLALGLFDQASVWQVRARERGGAVPYTGWWHCRLALTAIFRGDRKALEAQTDSLLAAASDAAPESWDCVAFNEVFLRRYSEARIHLERYVTLATPDEVPLNLGFLRLRLGDRAEAERILDKGEARVRDAATGDGASREVHFELAEIAAMRGEVDTALEHLEEAVALGLDHEWWVFHLFSRDALPDPVFEPLYESPRFEQLRAEVLAERATMRQRVQGAGGDEASG